MPLVRDGQGRRLILGEIIFEGGQGKIYQHPLERHLLVKLSTHSDPLYGTKIRALIEMQDEELLKHAAWPLACIYPDKGTEPIGFTMARAPGKLIRNVFLPRERHRDFPKFGWSELVHIARNSSIAFHKLHQFSPPVIVGDINDKNFLVTAEGIMHFIDCDSFQIVHRGKLYPCVGLVPFWTSPEMQDVTDLSTFERTVEHDLFGLAVLIFHLLFMGFHPFACRRTDDFSTEEAIKRHLFGYSMEVDSASPPVGVLPAQAVGDRVFRLFEQAFLAGSSYGSFRVNCPSCQKPNEVPRNKINLGPICRHCRTRLNTDRAGARPTAAEWDEALGDLQTRLVQCTESPFHSFLRGTSCPFCAGVQGFVSANSGTKLELEADDKQNWLRIKSYALPPFALPHASAKAATPAPLPAGLKPFRRAFGDGLAALVLAVILALAAISFHWLVVFVLPLGVFGLILVFAGPKSSEFRAEEARRRLAFEVKRDVIIRLEVQILALREQLPLQIGLIRDEASLAYEILKELSVRHDSFLARLNTQKRQILIEAFLKRQLIENHVFPQLGAARRALLKSKNLLSAHDVRARPIEPSGIPPEVWANLRNWANKLATTHNPDMRLPFPPEIVAEYERKVGAFRTERNSNRLQLRTTRIQLEEVTARNQGRSEVLLKELAAAQRDSAQAEADLELVENARVIPLPAAVEKELGNLLVASWVVGILLLALVGMAFLVGLWREISGHA